MPNVHIGKVRIGDAPRIVVTITAPDNPALAAKARAAGADIVELRLDYVSNQPEERIVAMVKENASCGLPILATIRTPREGGARRDGIMADEKRRLAVFEAILPFVQAVDIELSSPIVGEVVSAAHKKGKAAIISYHHFHSTPAVSRLRALAQLAKAKGADVVKIVSTTRTPIEMIRLLSLLHDRPAWPLSAFAVGPHALLSRLVAYFFQSSLIYAGLPGKALPGQPAIDELKATLKQFNLR